MSSFLKEYEHVMVALCLVGIVALLYKSFNVSMSASTSGFRTGSDLALIAGSQRSDPGFNDSWSGRANGTTSGFSASPYEPPVFWNPGSFGAVNDAQQSAVSTPSVVSGMAARADYARSGFKSKFDASGVNAALHGM